MYRLYFAHRHGDDISIYITPEGTMSSSISKYKNVICGRCLHKLGVHQAIIDEATEDANRKKQNNKQLQGAPLLPMDDHANICH